MRDHECRCCCFDQVNHRPGCCCLRAGCQHSIPIHKIFEIGSEKPIWDFMGGRCTKCQQVLPYEELKQLREMLEARGFDGDKLTKDNQ